MLSMIKKFVLILGLFNAYSVYCLNTDSTYHYSENQEVGRFVFRNDTIDQSLTILNIDESKIEFELLVCDLKTSSIFKLNGRAFSSGSGFEIDEDPDTGFSYTSKAYYLESPCWLAIRVDSELYNRVRIIEAGCEKYRSSDLTFSSVGLMRKEE